MASTPYSNINLPQNVTDPLYTSSQSSLDKLGSGLLNGDVPDYYKSIGDFNSPQFQAMLNSVKGQIMQGSQEASAINGTGRSGVATTASNNALNSVLPNLSYQDYLRAIQGRGALLDTGINVESGVRQSAQNQQQFDSQFNQTLFGDQTSLASFIDQYKKQSAGAIGGAIGNTVGLGASVGLAPFTGGASLAGVPGFAAGLSGAGSSSDANGISSLLSSLFKINTGSNGASYGIADHLGSFGGGLKTYDNSGLYSALDQNQTLSR